MSPTRSDRWVEGRSYFVPGHHYGPCPYQHERPTLDEAVALVASWPETDPDYGKPQRRGITHIEHRVVEASEHGPGVVEKPIAFYDLQGNRTR